MASLDGFPYFGNRSISNCPTLSRPGYPSASPIPSSEGLLEHLEPLQCEEKKQATLFYSDLRRRNVGKRREG